MQCPTAQAEAKFKADIENTEFSTLLNNDVSESPNLDTLTSVLVAPKTVKFKRQKHTIYQWITFGLIKSIKYGDSMYKHLHQTESDSQAYSTMETNLKTYDQMHTKLLYAPCKIEIQQQSPSSMQT